MNKFAELWQYVETVKPEIEETLNKSLPLAPAALSSTDFNDALHYSVFPGGKRLRPVLTLLGAELVGGQRKKVLPASAAVEFVHTSSLIFDDLPCMDDANQRRGKTALHQKFGEGNAVLVGLALLNASYGLVFKGVRNDCNTCAELAMRAHRELVECIGESGMVGGQSVDLAMANGAVSDANDFESLRNLKTSALMRMALRLGAILSGASARQSNCLSEFAELLGDAYQTSDDLLDLGEDLHLTQATERRATFALEQGSERAGERVASLTCKAKKILRDEFGETEATKLLSLMADYIAERKA